MPFNELVLASHNAGKLKELQAMLGDAVRVRSVGEFSDVEPEETGLSFIENAILKARNAARVSGLPALADDSGLTVDALDGAPGVYSARYARRLGKGSGDADNNRCLVEALAGQENRSASYVAVLVYLRHAEDPCPVIAEGYWRGRIVDEPAGENGFGYDPHFFLPDQGTTAAALAPEVKNRLSHRGQALRALVARLRGEERP